MTFVMYIQQNFVQPPSRADVVQSQGLVEKDLHDGMSTMM